MTVYCMRYGSLARRFFKIRWGLNGGLVQDHHVIPKQWRNHAVIKRAEYDLHSSCNLVMMPTPRAMSVMNLRRDRLVHYKGHPNYNKYVKFYLDSMNFIECDVKLKDELLDFRDFLKRNCRDNRDFIPW